MAENEKIEYKTSENMVNSFIEDWNDRNPKHKLDPEIIGMLGDYFKVVYVAGWDDHRFLVDKALYGKGETMSKHFFVKTLEDLESKV